MDITSSYVGNAEDERKGLPTSVWQAEVALRLSFLRKVYGILSVQLLLSVTIGGVCIVVPQVKGFVHNNVVLNILLMCFTLVILFTLLANRFNTPANYYLLILFTVLESLWLGSMVTYYDVDLVLKALFITCMVFVALTVYTMQSRFDFSTWGASLFSFLWILLLGGVMQFFFWSSTLEFVLTIAGTLVISGFIIFDTHLIMHVLSPEQYILAAINLYMDFVNLFGYILRILQFFRRE